MTSLLGGAGISVLIAVPLTCLATAIDIFVRSIRKAKEDERIFTRLELRACITPDFFLYLGATFFVNAAATVLAFYQVAKWSPEFVARAGGWAYLIYAVVGVLLFQVLAANTNVFIFNKGYGAIQNWIDEARDPAVSAAVEKQVRSERMLQQGAVEELMSLVTDTELDTRLRELLNNKEANRLEIDARSSRDPKLYKLLWLARRYPGETEAILEAKKPTSG